jgi:uncharacterized damage-inducible protein DinB
MISLFQELFRHHAYADAAMLTAIQDHEIASKDEDLRKLLHHILVAHRFWLHLCRGLPFSLEVEDVVPTRLDDIAIRYKKTWSEEEAWFEQLQESGLIRTVESPYFPNRQLAVQEALIQVCLHSCGHRASVLHDCERLAENRRRWTIFFG